MKCLRFLFDRVALNAEENVGLRQGITLVRIAVDERSIRSESREQSDVSFVLNKKNDKE